MSRIRSLGVTLLLLLLLVVVGASPAAAQGSSYVVKSGDTLYSIATRHGTTVEALMAANALTSPTIYVGQTLQMAGGGAAMPSAAAAGGTHVVQPGDTLFSIARRHGTTVEALMALNGLSTPTIYVGQVLRLSGAAMAATAAAPAQGGSYVVVPGDTLFSIAWRNGLTVDDLKRANGLGSDIVYVGQRLVIPAPGTVAAAAPAPAAPAGAAVIYIVRAGDSLTQIAVSHAVSVWALAQANGLQPGDWVYAGQRLVIPAGGQAAPRPAMAPAAASQGGYHIVRPGETLTYIAAQYRTTVAALVSANGLANASHIYVGQRLTIPGLSAPAAGSPPPARPAAPTQGQPAAPAPSAPAPRNPATDAPIVAKVWSAHVTNTGCKDEDTGDFISVIRVNVEGRSGQQVDFYAQPVQDSTLQGSMASGSKIELGPYGAEWAPFGAGKYAVVVPGIGRADFYLDGRCTVYVNFSQVSR
ncbi:MAG: LysM peptidoglycan-binding domain-containing protein [Ardenticatenales bacterium]|nr:LysM peptidoglycan-binding domain-containing protein [Ardenticatenales bacterium]